MPDANWYALSVRSNHEKSVAESLRSKNYEIFAPTYIRQQVWSDRKKKLDSPLLPGYVFCRLDLNCRTLPAVTTPGVLRLVGYGSTPVPVDLAELESVRRVAESGLKTVPWSSLDAGAQVRIVAGSLKGVEGTLVQVKNQSQLVVSISLLKRSVAVQIDPMFVRPVEIRKDKSQCAKAQAV